MVVERFSARRHGGKPVDARLEHLVEESRPCRRSNSPVPKRTTRTQGALRRRSAEDRDVGRLLASARCQLARSASVVELRRSGRSLDDPSRSSPRARPAGGRKLVRQPEAGRCSTVVPRGASRPADGLGKPRPGADAPDLGINRLRSGRRQRERQRLAVRPGAQRVIGADRLLERDRRLVVGDRAGVRLDHAQALQRLREARTCR